MFKFPNDGRLILGSCEDRLGVEVQFGKYAFMVYNVCAKMTIFNKLGFIDCGVEIVPIKQFADDTLKLYPDPNSEALKKSIADYFKVKTNNVFVGNVDQRRTWTRYLATL